jgi:hypothetical protein
VQQRQSQRRCRRLRLQRGAAAEQRYPWRHRQLRRPHQLPTMIPLVKQLIRPNLSVCSAATILHRAGVYLSDLDPSMIRACWRNGSASASRAEGWVFDPLTGQMVFFGFGTARCHVQPPCTAAAVAPGCSCVFCHGAARCHVQPPCAAAAVAWLFPRLLVTRWHAWRKPPYIEMFISIWIVAAAGTWPALRAGREVSSGWPLASGWVIVLVACDLTCLCIG